MKFLFQLPASESSIVNLLSISFHHHVKLLSIQILAVPGKLTYTVAWVFGFVHSMQLSSNKGKICGEISGKREMADVSMPLSTDSIPFMIQICCLETF